MLSRGQKIASMARTNDEKIYDFEEEVEDPWVFFNQWKKSKIKTHSLPNSESHSTTIISPTILDETTSIPLNFDSEKYESSKESENTKEYENIPNLKYKSEIPGHQSISCEDLYSDLSSDSEIITVNKFKKYKRIKALSETSSGTIRVEANVSHSNAMDNSQNFKENENFEDNSKNIKGAKNLKNQNNGLQNIPQDKNENDRLNTAPIAPRDILNTNHRVETSRRMGRVWDKKDRCPYCNNDVTNFSRHLFRKHSKEDDVRKILTYPKGDKQRKLMIDLLRKQGNFTAFSNNLIRPVQRPSSYRPEKNSTFLPCKYCKGLYKRESLNKHIKKCPCNNDNISGARYGSEGQTMLAFTASRQGFLNRLRLKNEVFTKMKVDRISLTGKNDPIICQYAEDYLRKHKRPHISYLVSNKIRELGRLLICLKDTYNINSMLEALKPENFDNVVSAARYISGYNDSTKQFKTPSLALHLRTILLTVSSTAITLLMKKDPIIAVENHSEIIKYVKDFRKLVESNWKFEMGSLALKDLTEKNSLSKQKLPITKDILLFNAYCNKVSDEAANVLKKSYNNVDAFKKLLETVLVLTISLNRKRVGDVQYITRDNYTCLKDNREECFNILTEGEKELTKNFKRIITIGKGSKAVPILFPKKLQEYIDLTLNIRDKTNFIPKENPYLFAHVGSKSKWIHGFSIMKKYAKLCGAQYPETITSSRLRKQIATVLQILSLNEVEMEQLATFMGHTKKTHEEFYRLPQEVFQTSKIAKLLLTVMGKGVNTEDQGKTIDELDFELNAWEKNNSNDIEKHSKIEESPLNVSESDVETNNDGPNILINISRRHKIQKEKNILENNDISLRDMPSTSAGYPMNSDLNESENSNSSTMSKKEKAPRETSTRGSWTSKHKKIMLQFFRKEIQQKIAPKKDQCVKLQKKFPQLFNNKTWVQIKVFVYNTYRNQH